MSLQEEKYVHFVSSINNLNTAWRILQVIKKEIEQNKGNPLVGPAFMFALIEYSKPYRCSYGEEKREEKRGQVLKNQICQLPLFPTTLLMVE